MTTQDYAIHVQQLFVRHQSAIKAFVLSLVPHFGEAEDVLQETFLTVSDKAVDFREGSNFFAWACAIARLKVLEAQRRGAVRTFSPEVVEALASSVATEVFDERRQQAVTECLDRLAPRLRELMERRYHRGQLPSEISRCLVRSLNYVNVALAKARTVLRECVERSLRRQEIP
jgi:RNA polymerase sigma-70 factor (ECF subfamily)